jgi:hypothetical protein
MHHCAWLHAPLQRYWAEGHGSSLGRTGPCSSAVHRGVPIGSASKHLELAVSNATRTPTVARQWDGTHLA